MTYDYENNQITPNWWNTQAREPGLLELLSASLTTPSRDDSILRLCFSQFQCPFDLLSGLIPYPFYSHQNSLKIMMAEIKKLLLQEDTDIARESLTRLVLGSPIAWGGHIFVRRKKEKELLA
ncbi:hypothetical protein EVAR_32509_1 [Eumeta japonica]|uniref:Uncharacterized protein n=1 Tax=Eumeta variegata TaxID=151549 RepID=A0A4C1W7W9_EUMVA|nr:hypothetical protein EVAR_32509_1 [Eumeta japonica]